MSEEKMYHFFYSKKLNNLNIDMNEHLLKRCKRRMVMFALIDGKECRYNICSQTMNHGALWDDVEYLGQGVFLYGNIAGSKTS